MSDNTGIEWTDATWNPIRGCSRVSEGCRNCYAERVASRFSGPGLPYEGLAANGKWTGKVRVVEKALDQPLRWTRPRKIFVNSMSDLFHENLPFEDVLRIFEVMEKAKHHTFQVLTKRPRRAFDFCRTYGIGTVNRWPENVWLGVSVENQAAAEERIATLLDTPATVRFLSCEPLLGPVDLCNISLYRRETEHDPVALLDALRGHVKGPDDMLDAKIDWVIAGGESGNGARPMHPEWARALRDQCAGAGVPFFLKQWGEWAPVNEPQDAPTIRLGEHGRDTRDLANCTEDMGSEVYMRRIGKKAAGAELDGREHKEFPR